jgi:hypothetical protein
LKSGEFRTSALIPIKSWWNQNWKENWWQKDAESTEIKMKTTGNQVY